MERELLGKCNLQECEGNIRGGEDWKHTLGICSQISLLICGSHGPSHILIKLSMEDEVTLGWDCQEALGCCGDHKADFFGDWDSRMPVSLILPSAL